jgi:nucleotide-binding universal stress UspA family protein
MRTILLPFYDDDASQHAFAAASKVARAANGCIEGLFVLRRPQLFDSDSEVVADSYFTQLDEERRRLADRAHERFDACAATHGISAATASASDAPTVTWREIEGMEDQVVGSHGRLFELIVIARQFGNPWLNWRTFAEAALFDSGRPVMLVPATGSATVGERVVISWNPSTETARTIALSMPLLTRAREVTVLTIEGWGVPGPTGKELAQHLVHAGAPAVARTVKPAGRSPAEATLAECASIGADLLIKGGYTQSRLRQMIFGGATRHIIAHAQIPVVLAT